MDNFLKFILLVDGLMWLRSGLGKLASGNFPQILGGILKKFADGNPYPPVHDFLTNIAIPNSQLFGKLVVSGEIFAGVAITVGILIGLKESKFKELLLMGLVVAAFLNLTFWLSAGWTSPSADEVNLILFVIEVSGVLAILKAFGKKA